MVVFSGSLLSEGYFSVGFWLDWAVVEGVGSSGCSERLLSCGVAVGRAKNAQILARKDSYAAAAFGESGRFLPCWFVVKADRVLAGIVVGSRGGVILEVRIHHP